jgi:hypothetical protein
MAIILPDPQHIASAKQVALEQGLEPETVEAVLGIASEFYHKEQRQDHVRMTEQSMADLGVLYKYRSTDSEYNWQLLENQEIYFADPTSFNDPFDSNLKLRFDLLSEEELRARFKAVVERQWPGDGEFLRKGRIDRYIARIQNPTIHDEAMKLWMDRLTTKIRVFCVCPDRANILLWSHYANNHRGFAVGFDSKGMYEFWKENHIFLLGHVAYRDTYPILLPPAEDDIITKQDIITSIMNIKSRVWAYEKEVRLTLFDRPEKIPFKAELIKEVVLGCKIDSNSEHRMMRVMEEKYPHAAVYRARLSRDAFALEFDRVK